MNAQSHFVCFFLWQARKLLNWKNIISLLQSYVTYFKQWCASWSPERDMRCYIEQQRSLDIKFRLPAFFFFFVYNCIHKKSFIFTRTHKHAEDQLKFTYVGASNFKSFQNRCLMASAPFSYRKPVAECELFCTIRATEVSFLRDSGKQREIRLFLCSYQLIWNIVILTLSKKSNFTTKNCVKQMLIASQCKREIVWQP